MAEILDKVYDPHRIETSEAALRARADLRLVDFLPPERFLSRMAEG